MMTIKVQLDLMQYVEQNILPRYNAFDHRHDLKNVQRVIDIALRCAENVGLDANMAYVIAAYHDLGLEGPKAIHHISGGKILQADARLKKWFNPTQIRIMKEAIEDHRASAAKQPRNIYGKMITDAVRIFDPTTVFKEIIMAGINQYPEWDTEKQWNRFYNTLLQRYHENGHVRVWLPQTEQAERLAKLRVCIKDIERLRSLFDALYTQEIAQGE